MTSARCTGVGEPRTGDRGVATVWAATGVAVVIGVLAAMLDLTAAVAARHRAAGAADLAALAAAGHAVRGREVACARAGDAAEGTGGRIVLCRLQGWEAVVEVEVRVRLSLLGSVTVRGRARAGPAVPGPTASGPTASGSAPSGRGIGDGGAGERPEPVTGVTTNGR